MPTITIWDIRLARVTVQHEECWVDEIGVEDLRWENAGYPAFVRAVLEAILQGRVYDDSDPEAAFQGGSWVWYLPVSKVHVQSPTWQKLVDACEAALANAQCLAWFLNDVLTSEDARHQQNDGVIRLCQAALTEIAQGGGAMFEISSEHIVVGGVEVEWVALGEGWSGDYDPDDPEDEELLRFDVSRYEPDSAPSWSDGWVAVEDASYCTQFPVSATPTRRIAGLCLLMSEFYEPVSAGYSVKKLGERLSWIGLDWFERHSPMGSTQ